ncbi:hypothetical protein ACIBRY_33665 [Streptomyces anulatus]
MRFTPPRPGRRPAVGVGSLLAALLLALVPLPQGADEARAAEAAGPSAGTSSAMTRSGTKGPHDDFSDLRVTVHQTADLQAQGVKVTWTGGKPTEGGNHLVNYLQIMQCWGDDPSGPDREQCDFGAVAGGSINSYGRVLVKDWDPLETEYTRGDGFFDPFVPFRPVEGEPTDSAHDTTYFGPNDSNAEPMRKTQSDGTGEAIFEVQTALQAPHLGCGAASATARSPRPCWLVVVPRGEHEIEPFPDGGLDTSALSQTNWNQRIVFPMTFDPVGDTCAPDKAERRVIGSELLTDAMSSWQTVLCDDADARFTFTQAGEDRARSAIAQPTPSSPGLAVTVDPVESADGAPGVVHAPLAVSGLAVGFLWEDTGTTVEWVRDLRLNPRLLAKMLTQSYTAGVRLWSVNIPEPAHVAGNPQALVSDPEFLELNPHMKGSRAARSGPLGIVVPGENSDTSRLFWRYLQSDRDAREFLAGKPDPWGMKRNPFYAELELEKNALDHFPKADPTETSLTTTDGKAALYTGAEIVPYSAHLHDGALRVRRGYSGQTTEPEVCAECATGAKLTGTRKPQGARQVGGLADAASARRYQLDVAALRNADGNYVKPSGGSLLAAVGKMRDTAVPGVKALDPGRATEDAYPLTAVVYGAASTDQAKDARVDYARMIRYAVGAGQTQGTARGELPHGYAPLPAALREQALGAAADLERGVVAPVDNGTAGAGGAAGAPAGSGGAGSSGGSGQSGAGSGDAAAGTTAGGSAGTGGAGDAEGSPPPAAGPPDPEKAAVAASGGLTPSEVLGIVRWVLLGVLVAGGAAALAGPVMLRLAARKAAPGPG